MRYSTVAYLVANEKEELYFSSEKEVCSFLGVSKCSVSSCYRRGVKCKGYTVKRLGKTSHLSTKTRLFKIWSGMHERCNREKHPHFKSYGGKGISVCDNWRNFETFKEWALSSGYEESLTIDRIDNNKGYEPDNCRWATQKEQARNKSNNHLVSFNGITKTISEWAEVFGVNKTTLRYRLEAGWDIEKAFYTPIRPRTKKYKQSKIA